MKSVMTPFAITARKLGKVDFLYTRIFVVNAKEDQLFGIFANALWDTGAPMCMMSEALAQLLHVELLNNSVVNGIGGYASGSINYTYINLVSNGDIVSVKTMIIDKIPRENCSFLLGMNFINLGSLALSFDGKFSYLSFVIPPADPIDFVQTTDHITAKEYISLSSGHEDFQVLKNKQVSDIINGINIQQSYK